MSNDYPCQATLYVHDSSIVFPACYQGSLSSVSAVAVLYSRSISQTSLSRPTLWVLVATYHEEDKQHQCQQDLHRLRGSSVCVAIATHDSLFTAFPLSLMIHYPFFRRPTPDINPDYS